MCLLQNLVVSENPESVTVLAVTVCITWFSTEAIALHRPQHWYRASWWHRWHQGTTIH